MKHEARSTRLRQDSRLRLTSDGQVGGQAKYETNPKHPPAPRPPPASDSRLRQGFGGQVGRAGWRAGKILNVWNFGFRILNLFRISIFEFRIYYAKN